MKPKTILHLTSRDSFYLYIVLIPLGALKPFFSLYIEYFKYEKVSIL